MKKNLSATARKRGKKNDGSIDMNRIRRIRENPFSSRSRRARRNGKERGWGTKGRKEAIAQSSNLISGGGKRGSHTEKEENLTDRKKGTSVPTRHESGKKVGSDSESKEGEARQRRKLLRRNGLRRREVPSAIRGLKRWLLRSHRCGKF